MGFAYGRCMGFQFSVWMLVPAVVGAIGLWAALNREKLGQVNLRHEKMLGDSRIPRRSDHDPTGTFNSIGGALLFVGCVAFILFAGFGLI